MELLKLLNMPKEEFHNLLKEAGKDIPNADMNSGNSLAVQLENLKKSELTPDDYKAIIEDAGKFV
ncbi:MAG: hypothetical protein B0D92_04435 [Spirochaeta sp. LUC14_002_19_P3]|nr:MAG: hypothetical protein B0D92_04435 [Spirochaeta sp. LUC14_002_19_P3]